MSGGPVYLDNAATTRLDERVLEAMLPYFREHYGNPGSVHKLGADAASALEVAREQVASSLDAEPEEVVFTSGGTEANALAILGAARARKRRGTHLVTSQLEHACVRQAFAQLEREGFTLTSLPADALTPEGVASVVTKETVLVSVMHVQNETGHVFPVEGIARACKQASKKLVVHSDGVQAWGKLPAPGPEVALYAVSGHKVHGPKGTGALRVARGTHLVPLVVGGGQECGLRGGTEGVPQLVGLGEAARLATSGRAAFAKRARALGERLAAGVEALGGVLNSPRGAGWIGSILNASFVGLAGEVLLHALEEEGVFASTTSACASRRGKTSEVLAALGLSDQRLESALRLSVSRETSEAEVERALAALEVAVQALRGAPTAPGRGS